MSKSTRVLGAVLGAAALTASLTACGGDSLEKSKDGGAAASAPSDSGSGSGKGKVVIGAAGFTESNVLAELYAQVLKDAGYSTSITTVNNRELYEPSLEKGEIDVVPEYAATLAEFLNAKVNGPKAPEEKPVASSDVAATVAGLEKLAAPLGLKVLPAGSAVDQNAFAVSKEFAQKNNLKTLSDLGKSGLKVKIAAGDECAVRPFCAPGLKKTYGIDVSGIDPKGVGTPQAKQAVKDGVDQLALTTTTDATLDSFGLVLLEDDKKLQNADNVLPVVNAKDAGSPEIAAALDKLTKVLTTADLVELNKKVDAQREKPADAAKAYLKAKGLTK
ncbi:MULTISPECIES: ABC transporter substrate-binding protein [unclassified Streptomyces]|uniref:ABC transporter substrate-binding protein n=1 Tax=Streptomyces sp. R33 TaxID=3238629 RepID=A0AB39Y4T0_9ACTN|nr:MULTISPECIES: ABC transporter substrate-binding protein [unclassified Streptomyces]KJY47855.1 amino acid ABC transporter substrate-binding protein [Streptomyces sp. NRRL S-444]KOY56906.1 amino acid ABC transporter substrate-binding protein [Streptomyces sp. XY332]TDU76817.1 osmoprotectant transport system substrate-binding protein [Streptomyces sp. KS 21]THA38402.1 ABC transporter substrate-binding protein [Streptomyces sp. A1547]